MMLPPRLLARATAIRAQVEAAKTALAEIEGKTRQFALRDAEGQPGARAALKEHQAKVDAAKGELELKRDAYDQALEADRTATAARAEAIRAMDPVELVEGIGRDECPSGCSDGECLLAGGLNRCCHPRKAGLPPEFSNDSALRAIQAAAMQELVAHAQAVGNEDEDEEVDETDDEFEDEDEESDEEEAA